MSTEAAYRCGRVAIVGRPNTGKSTLLNHLVGQAVSITADRPQTTRHRVLGVLTREDAQLILVDSPGYQTRNAGALNQLLNRTAQATAQEADVVVMVAQASGWTPADAQVLRLAPAGVPVVLALNKVDQLARRDDVLPVIARIAEAAPGIDAIVPISARTGYGIDELVAVVTQRLPIGPPAYDEDMLTDRSERFLAAELVREKLFRLLGDELPYESTVVIDRFELEESSATSAGLRADRTPTGTTDPGAARRAVRRIAATIVVERRAHKPMILGKGGERIKRIASEARQDMEKLFGGPVFLTLWVQVRGGWSKDAAHLRSYGYE
ncbi:MAG: GTPase Era [Burkholderiaceae bacterium]|nr:GTPase Era [Burkholderiaceae bacterium]